MSLNIKSPCNALFVKEGQALSENGGGTRNREASIGAQKIARSIHFMRQHLDQPLQVATIAASVHVSPSHFFVLFKRWAGCSPIDYFIRLRMRRACQLLDAGSLHVKEVAAALGYEDPFYFSRVFKAVHRVAPSDYLRSQMGCRQSESFSKDFIETSPAGPASRLDFGKKMNGHFRRSRKINHENQTSF
jgi:transcriptional regulator GlxA family with amidase domain